MNSFAQQWQKLWIDSIPIWNAEHLTEHSDPDSSLDLVDTSSLVASGYKSIRLVTGEGGMEFRQDMRLGLQGEAAPGWFIDARLVDEGLHPGEVRATTLDQVDEMYLRIMNGRARLTLGNFQFIQDSLNLFSTQHSSMGAHFEWLGQKVAGQWAFGQDPMYRRSVVFQGRDGQRTGYLVAMDGVSDVAVVPGSDAVWLNGEKLRPGIDYWINPVGGLLDFIGLLLPGPRDEIRVEYEEYTDGGSRGFAAGQASLLLGSLKINLANSGMWADSSEVDSTGRRITPTDLRLSGARVEWDAKRWGGYFLEGAVSRTDSLESTWGQAARWGLHSERLWDDFHTGPRYEYFGTWMDSVYNGGEQGGSFLEWDPWNLRENWELNPEQFAAGQRRLDQVRLGFSLFESLLPWVGYGFRRVGDLTNSARIEGGLKHRSATATSQVNVASVTSYQAEKTERIDLKLETEQLTGRLRPFGKGRSIWRQGQYDLLSSAGFAYGGQEAWGGTFAVEAENILDSLHSAQVKNAFEFSGEAWSGSSLLQWKRSWDANSGGSENSWISEQKGTWEYGAHHGSVHHRLGLTQEQPLVPAYKRVMDGSGDVLFDSLTQRYVEGVDHGDFIQDGFVRQDSLAGRQQGEVYLRMEEWVSPGVLMGVDHGILRDLRFAFVGEWQKRDSVGAVYLPPWEWSAVRHSTGGLSSMEGRAEWVPPGEWISFFGSTGASMERLSNYFGQLESEWWQELGGDLSWADSWTVYPKFKRSQVKIESPSALSWEVRDIALRVSKELPYQFSVEPAVRYRYSGAAKLWQPALTIVRKIRDQGEMRINYSISKLRSGSEPMPWQVMEGFEPGITQRAEATLEWEIQEKMRIFVSYLIRKDEQVASPLQKFTGEIKAFF